MPRWAVRSVFLAAVVALPFQVVVREVFSEPYPGLYQPSFGGDVTRGSTFTNVEPRVTVREADGSSHRVPYTAVLPRTGALPQAVFRSALGDPVRAQDPQTRRWLRQQLLAAEPTTDPRSVEVEWLTVERRFGSSTARVVSVEDETPIDVGPGS